MIGNSFWNTFLKLALLTWLYTGKILLTLMHALLWDLELPFALRSYSKVIHSFNNLPALKESLSRHYSYRNDPLGGLWDYYYLPHITWAICKGDCDDFAWMAADALSQHGIMARMATIIPQKLSASHVIVVYQSGGMWLWSEVGYWNEVRFPTSIAAVQDAAQSLGGIRAVHSQSFSPTHKAGEVFC